MIELGPVQPEDLALLSSIIGMVQPSLILEFGCLNGVSTSGILQSLPPSSHLISIDIAKSDNLTWICEAYPDTFTFYEQDQITPLQLPAPPDLVFFDASHDFDSNLKTMQWLEPQLAPDAIILVHDTGHWPHNPFEYFNHGITVPGKGYLHRPDELKFVNHLKLHNWNAINLGTTKTFRHGMSILQRN